METALALICVASLIVFIIGMIKPKLFLPDKLKIKNRRWIIFGNCIVLFLGSAIWGGVIIDESTSESAKFTSEPTKEEQHPPTLTHYEKGIIAFFREDYKEARKHLDKVKSCDTCFYSPQAILSIIEWRTAKNQEQYISKRLPKKWYSLLSVSDDAAPSTSIDRYNLEYKTRGDKVYSEEYFTDGRLIAFSCDDRNTNGTYNNYRYVVDGTTINVILPYATEKYVVEYISDYLMITKPDIMGIHSYFINPDNQVVAEQELLAVSRIAVADVESRIEQVSNLIKADRYIEANNVIVACRSSVSFRAAVDAIFNSAEVDKQFAELQSAIMPEVEAEYISRYESLTNPLFGKLKTSQYKGGLLDSLSNLIHQTEGIFVRFKVMGYNAPKLTQFNKSLSTSFEKERKDYELYGDGDIGSIEHWAEYNAKTILKNIARDPSSVKIEKVICDGKVRNGWKCRVQYRAKNGFGGYEREILTLIMQFDISNKVYKSVDAY